MINLFYCKSFLLFCNRKLLKEVVPKRIVYCIRMLFENQNELGVV